MSAREFFEKKMGGTMQDAHRATGVSYATLQRHVRHGAPIKYVDIARKLAAWDARISAAKTLGVD